GPAIAGWLGVRAALAILLVASLGLVLAATIPPGGEPYVGTPGHCDLSTLGLPALGRLLGRLDDSLNVVLFVPLGITVELRPCRPRTALLALGAAILPIGIELTQLVALPLRRACQSSDAAENLAGLAIGLAIAGVLGLVQRSQARGRIAAELRHG